MDWQLERSFPSSRAAVAASVGAFLVRHAEEVVPLSAIPPVLERLVDDLCGPPTGTVRIELDWSARRPVLAAQVPSGACPSSASAGHRCRLRSTATLDVTRRRRSRHGVPRVDRGSLPAPEEVGEDGSISQAPFLKALLIQTASWIEHEHGPDALDAALIQVGADVGNRIEDEYRRARSIVERLSPSQIADLFVSLKHAIEGDFYVVEVSEDRIVLGNRRCPFGEVVKRNPALCRMTSTVFGGISARNAGYSSVQLSERIAVGDAECRVIVDLRPQSDSPDVDMYQSAPVTAEAPELFEPDTSQRPRRTSSPDAGEANPLTELSPREREVLSLLSTGMTNQAIADRLVVSKGAIEKHLQRIFSKLGLNREGADRRIQAVVLYLRWSEPALDLDAPAGADRLR